MTALLLLFAPNESLVEVLIFSGIAIGIGIGVKLFKVGCEQINESPRRSRSGSRPRSGRVWRFLRPRH